MEQIQAEPETSYLCTSDQTWTTRNFLVFLNEIRIKLVLTQLSQIRLELKLADLLKPEIEPRYVNPVFLSIKRNPFPAKKTDIKLLLSRPIFCLLSIISSAKCMKYKTELNKTHKQLN